MLCEKLWEAIPATVQPRFIGDLPSLTVEGVALAPIDSNPNTEYFGIKSITTYPLFRFIIRTKTYPKGEDFCKSIKDSLLKHSDTVFKSVNQVGNTLYLGRTEEHLHEFQLTFKTIVEE